MSEEHPVDSHTFPDPEEALAYFSPEKMAAATPRRMILDSSGKPIKEKPEDTSELPPS
ncbi:hypothetical protein [Dermatophilus congolensis]|uniref:Uncharacterized protein n=1 Tax=Dermatophilus congolensis TaxID=1863 RepID=A0A239V3I8_9MICO|nr:hypothetical protein [Dermatophilus congolensis]MBO3130143.1 hypothetical protein [Dermatophilus congolensis]MBO3131230.1 hypothetical protein [Dermatophilus congolensis]MBO3134614.1 hypothetical protein [Dermatophilus congolensis]MBO3136851.1 hypothetical protein [Dermatophilus congolensis]MBO3139095.1 hypothetical protein [Dermatophilus congolensis]